VGLHLLILQFLWNFRWFRERVKRQFAQHSTREIEYEIRSNFEKLSDKGLDGAIAEANEVDWSKFPYSIELWGAGGITLDMIKQWLNSEKFLREHRRRHASQNTT